MLINKYKDIQILFLATVCMYVCTYNLSIHGRIAYLSINVAVSHNAKEAVARETTVLVHVDAETRRTR